MKPATRALYRIAAATAAACCLASAFAAEETPSANGANEPPYEYTCDSLKAHPVPSWFDDAKLGVFIHWGPQSIWRSPWAAYKNPDRSYPALEKQFGAVPPEFGYKDVVPMFKAKKWDPAAWAELFEKAGARYVILTGEHHDGFMLGDSELTEWCAAKIGPKRDLIGDLAAAVRDRGMKFAPSCHRERHPSMFSQGRRWIEKSPPCRDLAEEIRRQPEAADLYGPFEYDDAFIAGFVARWKEWERKYQPDFMWIDDCPFFDLGDASPQVAKYQDACLHMIADYLNAARGWGKEVYFNNKGRRLNWPDGVGCYEKDHLNMEGAVAAKWQCPTTMGGGWFYNPAVDAADSYKSPTELIHLLSDVVSKNGNLLLNVGPRPDGTIPEGMQERLLAVGDWLRINGEAIYGTRPWKVHREVRDGQDKSDARPAPIRYTQNNGAVYAVSLAKPAGPLLLRAAKDLKVKSVTLLGRDGEIDWTMTDDGLRLEPPADVPGRHAWVFKISLGDGD